MFLLSLLPLVLLSRPSVQKADF
ncbi:hypothetical protein LINPERHAP2_LOCUS19721 [Linum perenne]